MDLSMLAAIAALVALPTTILIWRMSHLEGVVDSLGSRIDEANSRIDATGQRIDAMGARIDTTQAIIMKMLDERGK